MAARHLPAEVRRCSFCTSAARFRPRSNPDVRLCHCCRWLHQNRLWELLAHRWITNRPLDWVDDVAEFLRLGGSV